MSTAIKTPFKVVLLTALATLLPLGLEPSSAEATVTTAECKHAGQIDRVRNKVFSSLWTRQEARRLFTALGYREYRKESNGKRYFTRSREDRTVAIEDPWSYYRAGRIDSLSTDRLYTYLVRRGKLPRSKVVRALNTAAKLGDQIPCYMSQRALVASVREGSNDKYFLLREHGKFAITYSATSFTSTACGPFSLPNDIGYRELYDIADACADARYGRYLTRAETLNIVNKGAKRLVRSGRYEQEIVWN